MTTPSVFRSIHGNRFGIQPASNGIDQLVVNGVAVTSKGSSETAQFGHIQSAANSFLYESVSTAITALAGGGSSAATPVLANAINELTVCATASDSVCLPASKPGLVITLINQGAAAAAVFPSNGTTDIINALSTGQSFAVANGKTATFTCALQGKWRSMLTA